jgi:hypothetical protein
LYKQFDVLPEKFEKYTKFGKNEDLINQILVDFGDKKQYSRMFVKEYAKKIGLKSIVSRERIDGNLIR